MAYSGRYQVKNPKKYLGDPTQVVYRSLWERAVFQWCDANPKVKGWSSEEVVVPYYYEIDKKYHRYYIMWETPSPFSTESVPPEFTSEQLQDLNFLRSLRPEPQAAGFLIRLRDCMLHIQA